MRAQTSQSTYRLFDTAIGTCAVAWSVRGLTHVRLPSRDPAETEAQLQRHAAACEADAPLPDNTTAAISAITTYLAGAATDFRALKLDWSSIPGYNARIYRALAQVPYGTTTTYGALADAIGKPGAARAVGVAMGRNPWPIVIPCHRVLGSGTYLGGFSAPGGVDTKLTLLRLEGSAPGDIAPMLPGLFD